MDGKAISSFKANWLYLLNIKHDQTWVNKKKNRGLIYQVWTKQLRSYLKSGTKAQKSNRSFSINTVEQDHFGVRDAKTIPWPICLQSQSTLCDGNKFYQQ